MLLAYVELSKVLIKRLIYSVHVLLDVAHCLPKKKHAQIYNAFLFWLDIHIKHK